VPREKINAGIPTYGKAFTLSDPDSYELDASVDGIGRPGEFDVDDFAISQNFFGMIPFNEICYSLKNVAGWIRHFDYARYTPFATYGGDQWVGYDDTVSSAEKARIAIRELDIGGLAYFNIETDDFRKFFF
jgi:chitinase